MKGVKRCSTLPNKAAKLGNSADAPGISGSSNRTPIQDPLAPPGQVGSTGKAPSQPPAVGSRKRRIESLKADMTKKMEQLPQVVDGVTINHDKNSILATFSVSKNRASKPIQSLDDEVEGQDDPPRKVTKVTFASDDDLGSPLAKSKVDVSEPQENGGEVNGEEDRDEEPDEEDDSEGELLGGEGGAGGNLEEFEEDEESSSDSGDEEEDDMLEDPKENLGPNEDPDLVTNRLQTRINLYSNDKMVANRVQCSILGLKLSAMEPTRKQVETSPIFRLQGLKEGDKTISNIAVHWISILANSNILGDKYPKAYKPPEGWPQIYSWESFRAKASEVASKLWRNRRSTPSIVVVIPPEETEFRKSYFLNRLHRIGSIRRVSVYYEDAKICKQRQKQYCFCGYCGVVSMNKDSGFSHMRKHLGVELICGGCLNYKDPIPKNMGLHMQVCLPCCAAHKARGLKEIELPTKGSKCRKGRLKKGGRKKAQ